MGGSALNLGSSHAFRFVLDAVPVPCWIHSDGVVRYANPHLTRLLGAPGPDRLAGRRVIDLLSPELHDAFHLRVSRLLAGLEVPPINEDLRFATGRVVSAEVFSSVISYDGETAILSFFHDITEQRRAEAGRRASEIRYQRLVQGEVVGVFEFTADGVDNANDVFLKLIGRTREDFAGGRLPWGLISAPEDAQLDQEKLAHLLATGECKPFGKEFLHADGRRIPVLMGASLLDQGPDWRAVALVIDMSDRRKLQEMEAEKFRLETVGILAAGMAHSLNNILTGVIGNASLLVEHKLVPPHSRAAAVAGEIVQAGERAAVLTAQLLAYSGRGRFFVVPINLRQVARQEAERICRRLPAHVRLTVDCPDELPYVVGDAEHLRQAVVALIDNAVEAVGGREDGAIEISVRVEPVAGGAILSRLGDPLPPGDYCVIEVRDNGEGMDENTLAHAFDPFFSTKFPGRGLSLAAVAGIVRAANGAIRVSSSRGLGSVFQVYLPAARAL